VNQMSTSLASSITKAASKQSYYTIRCLVDRPRVEDAYRAYAYFRWVDDLLDAAPVSGLELSAAEASARQAFLERQKSLLESCYHADPPQDVTPQENMLVELVRHDPEKNSGLRDYLRNMMLVMDFDARRRGRLVSQAELNEYTHWLAVAVTEALHYFIGQADSTPTCEARYLAVSAAHITHMLRDTFADVQAGYYNIPREVLEAGHIGPQDVHSLAYRQWVKTRGQLARQQFEAGRDYFHRVQSPRCRLACFAYIARFDWLLDTIEGEGYVLRPEYPEKKSFRKVLRMSWLALASSLIFSGAGAPAQPISSQRQEKI
jgi:phytoene/squalene synthetase